MTTLEPFIREPLRALADAIVMGGGKPYVVGGAVRDHVLGRSPKDIDVEVFGLSLEALERCLSSFRVDAVGRSFGVLKVQVGKETFDVALPRTESKLTPGHKGFVVSAGPNLDFAEAALRRDFTMNAIGYDILGQRLVDPHGGVDDLKLKLLRHVSPAFAEDPLRVLRGCQFAARFKFGMAPATVALCQDLVAELIHLPVERFWAEWCKLLDCPGGQPSHGLNLLVATKAVYFFPEVEALLHVPQDDVWHPEGQDDPLGSLWVHNGMVTDAALRVLTDDAVADPELRLVIMLGAFCHDLGKPSTTRLKDGRWRSLGHEEAGEGPTRAFLARIGAPSAVAEQVVPLVREHLKPFHFARDKSSPSAIRRLANRVSLELLCQVARADFLGRTTPEALAVTDSRDIAETRWLLEQAAKLKIDTFQGVEPLLKGRHLLELGVQPGKGMGDILKHGFEAQLDGDFDTPEGAALWARRHLARTERAADDGPHAVYDPAAATLVTGNDHDLTEPTPSALAEAVTVQALCKVCGHAMPHAAGLVCTAPKPEPPKFTYDFGPGRGVYGVVDPLVVVDKSEEGKE